MSKAIKKYQNGLSIRFIKKEKAYYITYGVMHIMVNGKYLKGFRSFDQAESVMFCLKPLDDRRFQWCWITKNI